MTTRETTNQVIVLFAEEAGVLPESNDAAIGVLPIAVLHVALLDLIAVPDVACLRHVEARSPACAEAPEQTTSTAGISQHAEMLPRRILQFTGSVT
ncbi:hypothetical protein O7626_30195 [Micromonospora sp. WMMD1102]|uniref:hypothetical protein n=1 Tax=Micromonospora sp. WMMD1102 TaxID=3016105 RepID=UPI002414E086|nr:hypothetical protein [Micromonospora sp. WMMD1102]MDG4790142.1 hypothetical protein [Micromonospora sp. WMMD1102]